MNSECGMRNAEGVARRDVCAARLAMRCIAANSAFRNPHSAIRNGLTLIELLVVIVILTTLVAGVIPVLSPNNEVRKIREASRGLQTYFTMAQAEAARTGRPHGVAFRETTAGSGVALEVFQLEVPVPFAGFSEESRCNKPQSGGTYGSGGNGGTLFLSRYNGFALYGLTLTLNGNPDPIPPRMFRIGDQIEVAGNKFLIVDDNNPTAAPNQTVVVNSVRYLATASQLDCIWLNDRGQQLPNGSKPYKIIRQPSNSAETPFQLPSGIAIDLQGSGLEGNSGGILNTLTMTPPGNADIFNSFSTSLTNPDTVGIMFSPSGAVESVYFNGSKIVSMSLVFLLLGRIENGGLLPADYDLSAVTTSAQLEERRRKINWLDLDSRWLIIAARSGRTIVSENAFVDTINTTLRDDDGDGNDINMDPEDQIEAAHLFADEMKRGGGG